MSKRGSTKHLKRIAAPKAVPIEDKKESRWMMRPIAGTHPKKKSIPIGVLLRDVLNVVNTSVEAKRILSKRMVLVDGKVRTEIKSVVGLMDVVSIPKINKHYRLVVDWKGRIVPMEITPNEATHKLLKIVGKTTVPGGKISVSLHDGRNLLADNHLKVGDTILVSLPKVTMKTHLKSHKGATCLVSEGKHAGAIVKLKDIIVRKGSKPSEAVVENKNGEFITVAKYLFVVDDKFHLKGETNGHA